MFRHFSVVTALFLAILVAISSVIAPASPVAEAASTPQVAFTLPNLTAQVGSYVTVPIVISGGPPVSYVGVLIKYDKTRLQLSGLPGSGNCNLAQQYRAGWSNTEGLVWFSLISLGAPLTAACTRNMSFKVIGEGSAPIEYVTTLHRNGYNTTALTGSWGNRTEVSFTTVNGQVQARPAPQVTIQSSLTTTNSSWPTYVSGNSRVGSVRVDITSSQYINIRYWLEFNGPGCRVSAIQPGIYYWTGMKLRHVLDHNIYLLPTAQGQCNITLQGYTTSGRTIPPTTLTVWVR